MATARTSKRASRISRAGSGPLSRTRSHSKHALRLHLLTYSLVHYSLQQGLDGTKTLSFACQHHAGSSAVIVLHPLMSSDKAFCT